MSDSRKLLIAGIVASIIFVVIGVFWLSLSAESLDKVAEEFGKSESPVWAPPIPDYEILGLEGNAVTKVAVGLAFTLFVLGVTFVAGKALRKKV